MHSSPRCARAFQRPPHPDDKDLCDVMIYALSMGGPGVSGPGGGQALCRHDVARELADTLAVALFEDRADVALQRLLADPQLGRRLAAGVRAHDHGEDLPLPRRESLVSDIGAQQLEPRPVLRARIIIDHACRQHRSPRRVAHSALAVSITPRLRVRATGHPRITPGGGTAATSSRRHDVAECGAVK